MDKELLVVKSRVEDCLVSITWTHKIHEKQADIYGRLGSIVTVLSCLATALAGSGALSMLGNEEEWLKWLTAIFAFASLFLFVFSFAFDFSGKASEHKHAAKTFLALREEARNLLTSLSANALSATVLLSSFNALSDKYVVACSLAPQTTDTAVKAAGVVLKDVESMVASQERELFCGGEEGRC